MQRELSDLPEQRGLENALRDYFREAVPSGAFLAQLACVNEEIVACSGMVIDRHPPSRANVNGRIAYIMNMYTLPEHRGRGIATALLSRLIDQARTMEIAQVVLHGMPHGRGIYTKAGFIACDSEMRLTL